MQGQQRRLETYHIDQIERALARVGRFGHVRLVMENGRLCYIEVMQSHRVVSPCQDTRDNDTA